MNIGITCKWECPPCGNVINTSSPFWDEKSRKNITNPKKCGCGRTTGFRLIDFEKCLFTVLPKGTKIVDNKGKTLFENTEDEGKKE